MKCETNKLPSISGVVGAGCSSAGRSGWSDSSDSWRWWDPDLPLSWLALDSGIATKHVARGGLTSVVGAWGGAGGAGMLWVDAQSVALAVVNWDGIWVPHDVVGHGGHKSALAGC